MIFISYRRRDAAGHAGRLFDRLRARYGRNQVFMDVDTIQPGEDFERLISERVGTCRALIVLIGDDWLEVGDARGRRLENPEDPVRLEIESAIGRGIPVFPVLVEGAGMPPAERLPESIRDLSRRQALGLSDARFDRDVDDLVGVLDPLIPVGTTGARFTRRLWIAGMALAISGGLCFGVWRWSERKSRRLNLTGRWEAEARGPRGEPFRIVFEFLEVDRELGGTVTYPTGSGLVRGGRVQDARVTFATEHVPQFADSPAVLRYEGVREGDELRLRMVSSDSVREVLARRVRTPSGQAP